jgi:hypothetical protein
MVEKLFLIIPTGETHPACGPVFKCIFYNHGGEILTADELFNMRTDDSFKYTDILERPSSLIGKQFNVG